MISFKHVSAAAVCAAAISVMAPMAYGASVNVSLGGNDANGGDGSTVSANATLGSNTSADVNLNLGTGSDGNLLDLKGTDVGDINGDVTLDDGVDARLGIGDNIAATGDLLGSGGNNSATLDLSGLGLGNVADLGILDTDLLGSGGATGGNSAGDGGAGGNAVIVANAGGGGTVGVRSNGACSITQGRQVLQLAARAKVNIAAWQRAANVAIVPVQLCASTKAQVAKVLNMSPKINSLHGAVAADALISASLGRTRYDASDVFAVGRTNGQLTVYVY